jgi:hypothetical protein
LARSPGNKYISKGNDAIAPFGNNCRFEDDCNSGRLCKIVSNPLGKRFCVQVRVDIILSMIGVLALCKDGVD